MTLPDVNQQWSGRISPVTVGAVSEHGGTRGREVVVGGQSRLPFLGFEGDEPNAPAIAIEVLDTAPESWPPQLEHVYGEVWSDPAKAEAGRARCWSQEPGMRPRPRPARVSGDDLSGYQWVWLRGLERGVLSS